MAPYSDKVDKVQMIKVWEKNGMSVWKKLTFSH